mmetsp:Transcript_20369/g.34099  ORF Transcript_20369/g.34099 Transcript_20369/m.34099 type:complete len:179 (-) Transcript_20369:1779-2315(-)
MDTTYVSKYNTEKVKYSGPLAVVTYEGPRNSDNQMNGEGKCLFANGSTYEGGFFCDMLHGKGILRDEGGSAEYNGDFQNDKRHGMAVFTYDGGVYEGHYEENKRHGQGKETDSAGNIFEGLFQHGNFVKGKVYYSNDDIYVGEWNDDCGGRHGQGKFLRFEDGLELEGIWINDKYQPN